ncbi:phosphatase PAP2 family protein [Methylocaldum sp.]|uniref:phosphatase PAP2 family protein n=1 Tax=Methylocaldum sp. TaxID=1969727 RepID=UPI002D45D6E4|nr:phosphatase PAP2 family protein [Methylocaldum sp.]HYE37388.1 phosphatase PAP2 family protein [Methylocaldum sp.]
MKFMQTIQTCDVNLFLWVTQRKSRRVLVRCARCISKTGDGHLYLILALALAWTRQPTESVLLTCLLLGFAIERPVYFILKNLCRRDRPQAALNIPSFIIPSDRFSFPSGHTSAAFLVATLLSFFHPAIMPLLIAWAVLMGMARVVLGVHFPTDTLIGALMGTLLALLSLEIQLT